MHQMPARHGGDLVCMKVRFSLGGGLFGGGSLGYIASAGSGVRTEIDSEDMALCSR